MTVKLLLFIILLSFGPKSKSHYRLPAESEIDVDDCKRHITQGSFYRDSAGLNWQESEHNHWPHHGGLTAHWAEPQQKPPGWLDTDRDWTGSQWWHPQGPQGSQWPGSQDSSSPSDWEGSTTAPGNKWSEFPGSQSQGLPGTQSQESPGTPGNQSPKSPGSQSQGSPGTLGSQWPESPGSQFPGSPGSQSPESPGSQTQGSPGQSSELPDGQSQGSPGNQSPESPSSQSQGLPGSQSPGSPSDQGQDTPGSQTHESPGSQPQGQEGSPGSSSEHPTGSEPQGLPGGQWEQSPGNQSHDSHGSPSNHSQSSPGHTDGSEENPFFQKLFHKFCTEQVLQAQKHRQQNVPHNTTKKHHDHDSIFDHLMKENRNRLRSPIEKVIRKHWRRSPQVTALPYKEYVDTPENETKDVSFTSLFISPLEINPSQLEKLHANINFDDPRSLREFGDNLDDNKDELDNPTLNELDKNKVQKVMKRIVMDVRRFLSPHLLNARRALQTVKPEQVANVVKYMIKDENNSSDEK